MDDRTLALTQIQNRNKAFKPQKIIAAIDFACDLRKTLTEKQNEQNEDISFLINIFNTCKDREKLININIEYTHKYLDDFLAYANNPKNNYTFISIEQLRNSEFECLRATIKSMIQCLSHSFVHGIVAALLKTFAKSAIKYFVSESIDDIVNNIFSDDENTKTKLKLLTNEKI
jgi:hypothetical protein